MRCRNRRTFDLFGPSRTSPWNTTATSTIEATERPPRTPSGATASSTWHTSRDPHLGASSKLLRIRTRRAAGGQRPGQEVRTGLGRMGKPSHRAPPLAGAAIGEASAMKGDRPAPLPSTPCAAHGNRNGDKSLSCARSRHRKGPKNTMCPTYAHLSGHRKGKV